MDQQKIQEILNARNEILSIEKMLNNGESLSYDEIEKLGLFYRMEGNIEKLSDSRFDYVNFRYLYLIYGRDLTFTSKFYKRNPDKNVSEHINFKALQEANKQEYNSKTLNEIESLFIEKGLLIEISEKEVQENKNSLEEISREWGHVCLVEKYSEENLKVISKETRDTLTKKKIEDLLNDKLIQEESKEVFKGLLKSYYIFHEAQKIIDKIDKNNEKRIFEINGFSIELNFYSLIHILNRHFAEMISSQNLIISKSFHNPKIDPYNIHFLINEVFESIKSQGLEGGIIEDASILFKFHDEDYALFFKKYKYNNNKTVFDSLFVVEENNVNAKRLIEKIKNSDIIELNGHLYYYQVS